MRKGFVLSYNSKAGVGLLVDENQQRIKFFIEGFVKAPRKGEEILFEISFKNGSLAALGVNRLTS